MRNGQKLPLVYSCSGESSTAQMADHIAVTAPPNEQPSASGIAVILPTSSNAGATPPADSTSEAEDELRECASPPCYLSEFTD